MSGDTPTPPSGAAPSGASTGVATDVIALADRHAHRWQDRDDHYWFARLSQEVGELGSSLVGDHKDPPEHELRQIGSIAINWLRHRAAPGGETRKEANDG